MASGSPNTFPSTGLLDIVRLIGRFGRSFIRHPFSLSPGLVLSSWIWGLTRRRKSDNIVVNLGFKKILLVTGKELSNHILDKPPSTNSYVAGPTKTKGMSFLAPEALTICHDQQWQRLRSLNEQLLSIDASPVHQQAVLDQVHQAFAEPVSSVDDLRGCMGRAMLGVVFGGAPAHLVEDIEVLFSYVQSPLKRTVLGWRQRGRRARFFDAIRQMSESRESTDDPSLLTRAHGLARMGGVGEEELLQQAPHWMFTFTGSGTDLLTRTLAMVGSRPEVGEKVRQEIAVAGALDQANSISRLIYLEACLMETCRLFPPVTRTIHVAPEGDTFGDISIRAGMEIWHYFPASYRDDSVDPLANHYLPEKWLESSSNRRAEYPNLFLSGARACPGEDLILFICKAAIAILTEQRQVRMTGSSLATDPLPFSFPGGAVRFVTG